GARFYPPLGSRRPRSKARRPKHGKPSREPRESEPGNAVPRDVVPRGRSSSRMPAPPASPSPAARSGSRVPPAFVRFTPAELPENAPIESVDGVDWVGAHDLARLLGATKFWRPDVRKLELRSPSLRILLTQDNPFVLIG